MKKYNVFQQRHPIAVKVMKDGKPMNEWAANLIHVGHVIAENGAEAIEKARESISEFRSASRKTLGAYPIVEPV